MKHSLISCEECGLVVELPKLAEGEAAHCPRCQHTLSQVSIQPFQRAIAYASGCLIMLVLSISFPFMAFSVQGLTQEIVLLQAASVLGEYQNSLLAMLLLFTVIVLPGFYIALLLYLNIQGVRSYHCALAEKTLRHIKWCCKALFFVEPWLMVDVFLIGILVSLVKIASLADISMGHSFWAFCIYTMLVVKCMANVDKNWLWNQFIPPLPIDGVKAGDSHLTDNHQACHVCHQVNPAAEHGHGHCIRCHSHLHSFNPGKSLQKAWALLITAAIFYLPANLFPIMYTVSLGSSEPATIMGGVILLWHHGSYPIASIIFIASVFIPMAKMFALAWLFYSAKRAEGFPHGESMQRQKLYRLTEFIGRWSMIDIFVVAILVALVQLQNLMAIYPGPAALSFAAVVIFTMLSAMKFDSRVLWQDPLPFRNRLIKE